MPDPAVADKLRELLDASLSKRSDITVSRAEPEGGNVASIFADVAASADVIGLSPTTVRQLQQVPGMAHLHVDHFTAMLTGDVLVYVDSTRDDDEYVKDVAVNYARALHMRNPGIELSHERLVVLKTDKPASKFHADNADQAVWRWIFRVAERP